MQTELCKNGRTEDYFYDCAVLAFKQNQIFFDEAMSAFVIRAFVLYPWFIYGQ